MATPPEPSRGTCGSGAMEVTTTLFSILILKSYSFKDIGWVIFSRGNFTIEGGGTLTQNSYKPSLDLYDAT